MTASLKFFNGHAGLAASALFGTTEVPALPEIAGDWVQLGGELLTPEALGQTRSRLEAAGGRLRAVIPEALLLPSDLPAFTRCLHLDVYRGAARVTTLAGGDRIEILDEQHVRESGLATLEKRIAAGAAAACVAQTRFDPLHSQHAESQLRKALAQAIPALADHPEVTLTVEAETFRITAAQLAGWCQPVWAPLLATAARAACVLLSPACQLPHLPAAATAAFGDRSHLLDSANTRSRESLVPWLHNELPNQSSWLLKTRPVT